MYEYKVELIITENSNYTPEEEIEITLSEYAQLGYKLHTITELETEKGEMFRLVFERLKE